MTEQIPQAAKLPIPADIVLKHPIPYGTGTLDRITLKRPLAGALASIKISSVAEADIDTALQIVAKASTRPITVQQLRAVKAPDIPKLVEACCTIVSGLEGEEEADHKDGRVPLLSPIPLGEGEQLEELHLMPPDAGQLRGIGLGGLNDMEVGVIITIAERCSVGHALKPGTLRLLDPADVLRIGRVVTGFFGD